LRLAMEPGFESTLAAPGIVAFTYGPLVLAAALGREGLAPGDDIVVNERQYGRYNDSPIAVPKLAGDPASLVRALRPTSRPLEFALAASDGGDLRLVPYHRIAHERYATYWKLS